ncbi:MAG: hypothetical protein J2P26_00215 [Nocardiopsaceae bacterium]|nr:hypothetical protein [Nocardiopsaceae bacterium]
MVTSAVQVHPLAALMQRDHLTATAFLRRVATRHQLLGFGAMAYRREKMTRWTRQGTIPERTAQLAIANLYGIDDDAVDRYGWPDFLLLALADDHAVLTAPWTPAGTVEVLAGTGGPVEHGVDRRGFLIAASSTLAASLAQWVTSAPAVAVTGRTRRIGMETAAYFDARLDALRHLDDAVGASQVYDAALLELRLITGLLTDASYGTDVGRRLYGCASEASRLAGWCAFDAGWPRAAERLFLTSLRAAGSAADPTLGASTLAFWANLRYAAGHDPRGALDLIDGALADRRKLASPRLLAMLHARAARAHAKAGEPTAAWRAVDQAFAAYASAPPPEQDLPSLYWINHGELHQVAASSALTLGEPSRALQHFADATTHTDPYDTEREVRGVAIYRARQAEAHLALGDIDGALDVGRQVIAAMGGVESARATDTLTELRASLTEHRTVPAVAEFLDYAAG